MVPGRAPVYLIAGGRAARRSGADPLAAAALRCAGRVKPSVAYVGAASGDNSLLKRSITARLQRAGAGAVSLAPLCGRRADAARARRVLESSDIVFMSGGDVDEGMRVLTACGMVGLLTDLFREGKPFFGFSAGSIMLASSWVRWRDPGDDASAELFPCLGFAPVLCDTHGEADGWEELRTLARLAPPGSLGYGITSGAALVVAPDGTVSALGGDIHRFCRTARTVVQQESLLPS